MILHLKPSLKTLQTGQNITRLFFFTLPVTVHFITASASRFQTPQLAISCTLCRVSFFWWPSSLLHTLPVLSLSLPPSIRTILGGHTDASIDVSDPISDHFYKEVWMSTCARNATIYQRVSRVTPRTLQNYNKNINEWCYCQIMKYDSCLKCLFGLHLSNYLI